MKKTSMSFAKWESCVKPIYAPGSPMEAVLETCSVFAEVDWPVLLEGETGTGKEVLAHYIHENSRRARGAFVPINCGALPAGVFESELFGHEKGAFSGATTWAKGLIREGARGTVFLDEIGELDTTLQVKLLRLVETGEVRAVGSTRTEHVSARFIAATNVDLASAVAKGQFREDLWQRLKVLRVNIPPLRERLDDIPQLAQHFLAPFSIMFERCLSDSLKAYSWPGNVRQLKHFLIRCAILKKGVLGKRFVERELEKEGREGFCLGDERSTRILRGSLADIEREVILEKLRENNGNRKRTARELGIAKSTLHEKLKLWQKDGCEDVPAPGRRVAMRASDISTCRHG